MRPRFLSVRHRRLRVLIATCLSVLSVLSGSLLTGAAQAVEPQHVAFDLDACRNPSVDLEANGFLCADGDYVDGNLGKTWNELDLIPYRLATSTGGAAPALQTYTVAIVADFEKEGHLGYDVVSAPVLNDALSGNGCVIDAGASLELRPGLQGVDASLYRLLTITQPANTTCVFDYYQRLAMGSHLWPGASLHANLANQVLTTAGIGSKEVSIPVKEISPQTISKEMRASQGRDYVWNVTKSATPSALTFPDTCDTAGARSLPVDITVSWTRAEAPAGLITVVTNIYATNPAHRSIGVSVTDEIRSGSTVLEQVPATDPVDVPAGATQLVATNTVTVPAGTTDLNDVATASYVDFDTQVPIIGTATATAQASGIQLGSITNDTATIVDTEVISGEGLSFSVDQVAGATGSFGSPYTLGTAVTGPLTWTSAPQNGNGSVTFHKSVRVDQARITSGTLSDAAVLTTSAGEALPTSLDIPVTARAAGRLTIVKNIPNVLGEGQSVAFTFEVTGPDGPLAPVTLTLATGQTSTSAELTGLAPGEYRVHEVPSFGWAAQPDQLVTIQPPVCAVQVSFANQVGPALASVRKVTNPVGSEASWQFTLTGPGIPAQGETVTTDGPGASTFTSALQEGTYSIAETPRSGWDLTSVSLGDSPLQGTRCTFTVDYPAEAGREFACSFTNTQRGNVAVNKTQDGDAPQAGFTFRLVGGPDSISLLRTTSAGQGTLDFGSLRPGSYTLCEVSVGAGWISSLGTPDAESGDACLAVTLAAGQTLTFLVDNTTPRPAIQVTKVAEVASVSCNDSGCPSVTYRYTVTNTGNVTLSGLTLDDDKIGPIALAVSTLAPGASTTVSAAYTPTAADLRAGKVVNVATAAGTAPDGAKVSATDDAVVELVEVLPVSFTRPTPPPAPAAPEAHAPAPEVAATADQSLPFTGANTLALLLQGLAALMAGLALLSLPKRRQHS